MHAAAQTSPSAEACSYICPSRLEHSQLCHKINTCRGKLPQGIELRCHKHLIHVRACAGQSQVAPIPFLHRLSPGTHVAAVQRSALRARHPASHHGCTLASLEGWSCRRGRTSKRLLQEWPRRMLWCQCSLAMLPRCVYSAAHCTSYSNCNQYSARIGDLRVRPCGPWAASCPVANSVAVCACVHSRGPPSCLPLRARRGRSWPGWGWACVHDDTTTQSHCSYPPTEQCIDESFGT